VKWWRLSSNGVAEKRGLAGDPRGGHFQATGSSILPLHRNMAGLPLMFAWPSARYFRERLSMHLNGCLRFDITVLDGVTHRRSGNGKCVFMHGKTHLTHHNLFILSTPISPSHSATRPKACHASKRDVPPYSRTHLFSKSKDYLSLICRSGMLSGSALQMHMHACRQRRRRLHKKDAF
jgi:hypothetical protein